MARIVLLNRALARIGALPIASEADPFAEPHLACYDSVVGRLGGYPFSFLRTIRQLPQVTPPQPQRFSFAYQLPSDRLGPPRAVYDQSYQVASASMPGCGFDPRPVTDFDIVGDVLLTNQPQIWIAMQSAVNDERWPGDFRELVVTAVMAELSLSIREDRSLHDRLYVKAFGTPQQNGVGGMMAGCLEMDSQGTPSTIVGGGENPLIDVRW